MAPTLIVARRRTATASSGIGAHRPGWDGSQLGLLMDEMEVQLDRADSGVLCDEALATRAQTLVNKFNLRLEVRDRRKADALDVP